MKKKAPQKRNADRTKEKIFSCAADLFAKNGFFGTTLDEIISKAKVNKRMIYHYFGNKEKLYREIHLRHWNNLKEAFFKFVTEPGHLNIQEMDKPEDLLLACIRLYHQFIRDNTDFLRLSTWDALEGGSITRSLWKEVRAPLCNYFEGLFSIAQDEGAISKKVEAKQILVSMMGMISFYFIFSNSLEDMLGQDPLDAEALKAREDSIVEFCKHLLLGKSTSGK